MSPKARRITGLVLIWLVGLALAASAGMKLAGMAEGESASAGGLDGLIRPLGVVELLSAVLLLVPLTHRLGLLLCTAYLGGAIAASIVMMGLAEALPAAILQALLWTGATLRTPDLLGPLLVRPAPVGAPPVRSSAAETPL
ncbi:DoxX family protein [Alienimonas californiensis]|uniref:DoxX n=1 Tax=Alienimonas californiensis TaxID=2527989 RepID=A0A517PC54_9PLAN|nr:DoxX family protein [Alienimonas californiensis]QDT16949.1 hypothetical protein CA12_30590 [Alienimonas californiensis]